MTHFPSQVELLGPRTKVDVGEASLTTVPLSKWQPAILDTRALLVWRSVFIIEKHFHCLPNAVLLVWKWRLTAGPHELAGRAGRAGQSGLVREIIFLLHKYHAWDTRDSLMCIVGKGNRKCQCLQLKPKAVVLCDQKVCPEYLLKGKLGKY